MLPQFIDENPRVLAVVYGDRDQLHAALLKSPLEKKPRLLSMRFFCGNHNGAPLSLFTYTLHRVQAS
jgi:hypothetical protein